LKESGSVTKGGPLKNGNAPPGAAIPRLDGENTLRSVSIPRQKITTKSLYNLADAADWRGERGSALTTKGRS